jgi:hypothetical protein
MKAAHLVDVSHASQLIPNGLSRHPIAIMQATHVIWHATEIVVMLTGPVLRAGSHQIPELVKCRLPPRSVAFFS